MWELNELFGELFSDNNDIETVLANEFVQESNEISVRPNMNNKVNHSLEQCTKNDEPETTSPSDTVSSLAVASPEEIIHPSPIPCVNSNNTSVHTLPNGASYQAITSPFPIYESSLYTGSLVIDHL